MAKKQPPWANKIVGHAVVEPDALLAHPLNARVHGKLQTDATTGNLNELGWIKSVQVSRNSGRILDGHLRVALALSRGEQVPVEYIDISEAAEAQALATLDPLAELATYDATLLDALLKEVQTGDAALQEMLAGLAAEAGLYQDKKEIEDPGAQIDKADELRQKWGTEPGQLWQLGKHKLACGDCTDKATVERLMGGEKAAIVSDPPYGINVDTSWLSSLNMKRGKPANKSDDKLVNDDGSLDLSWVYAYPEWLIFGFPYVARNEAYTGLLVWDKRGDGGENGLGNPVEVAVSNAFNGYRLSRHVWAGYIREAGEKREPHPTQKPVGIMVDAVNLVKSKIILDPFAGTGTTGIACESLNRQARLIEIDPGYCGVILERWATATNQQPQSID